MLSIGNQMSLKIFKQITLSIFFVTFALAEINVYSHRHYESDKILFKKFTNSTGIKVNIINARLRDH